MYFVLFSTNISDSCEMKETKCWGLLPQLLVRTDPIDIFECSISLPNVFDWIRDHDMKLQFRFLEFLLWHFCSQKHFVSAISIPRAIGANKYIILLFSLVQHSHPPHNSDEKIFLKASNLIDWTISSSSLTLSPWRAISSRHALLSSALINWMAFFLVFRMDIPR